MLTKTIEVLVSAPYVDRVIRVPRDAELVEIDYDGENWSFDVMIDGETVDDEF